jgi:hypothetical protein
MSKPSFSGHEKFHCRPFWLKKGYDFVLSGKKFSDDDAVVALGVGKNMVSSIRYWIKAFDLVDDQEQPNNLAHYIFGEDGKDPYLEDEGTIWLLHYHLVTGGKATLYSLFFNEFRKERIEFTKEQVLSFLKRKCDEWGATVSLNSLNADIDVFIKTYLRPKKKLKDIEDDFSGLLIDFGLVQALDKSGSELWYKVESNEREDIPVEILLYSILDQESGSSISFRDLLNGENSAGVVYAMNESGLTKKIQDILARFPTQVVFSDDAGIRELQFKVRAVRELPLLDKRALLNMYYGN